MWAIFQLIRASVMLFLAVSLVRIATALSRALTGVQGRREHRFGWRWWLAWLILLPIATALVAEQIGGFYAFTDSRGGVWSYFGHGWPLCHQFSLTETAQLSRNSTVAAYLAALIINLGSTIAILAATRCLLDRWIPPGGAEPRGWRFAAREVAAFSGAICLVLLIDRMLADPVIVPGTATLFYSPLVHDLWYCWLPIIIGLSCLTLVGGRWLLQGIKAFSRLREEGVL